jgi:hypothetical protein
MFIQCQNDVNHNRKLEPTLTKGEIIKMGGGLMESVRSNQEETNMNRCRCGGMRHSTAPKRPWTCKGLPILFRYAVACQCGCCGKVSSFFKCRLQQTNRDDLLGTRQMSFENALSLPKIFENKPE